MICLFRVEKVDNLLALIAILSQFSLNILYIFS